MREFSGVNGTVEKGYRYLCADCNRKSSWFPAQDQRFADGLARHAGWSKPRELEGWLCPPCVKEHRLRQRYARNRKGRKLMTPTTSKQRHNALQPVPKGDLAGYWERYLARTEPRGNDMGEMRK